VIDYTPGLTYAREAAKQLRGGGGGTSWKGPAFSNPTFSPPEPFTFAHDSGLTCANCGSGATRRISPQRRECIRCHAVWETSAQTEQERQIEAFRAKEAAK
jgi:hypothetical protein